MQGMKEQDSCASNPRGPLRPPFLPDLLMLMGLRPRLSPLLPGPVTPQNHSKLQVQPKSGKGHKPFPTLRACLGKTTPSCLPHLDFTLGLPAR